MSLSLNSAKNQGAKNEICPIHIICTTKSLILNGGWRQSYQVKFCECLLFIRSNGNMSSNSRITRSKGPADGVSLPPIMRPKKGTNTEAETEKSMATQHQADGQDDQPGNTVEQASPFARPGSRAGASTAPTNATEVLPASSNPGQAAGQGQPS